MPQVGDIVNVHHKGRFLTGKKIPNADSYEVGSPLTFKVGLGWVIEAWDEAVLTMKEGGKRKIIATPDKAYFI